MKDIEKLLASMKPIEAPSGLRRKIAIIPDQRVQYSNFFLRLIFDDWNGLTSKIWLASPCLIVAALMIGKLFDTPIKSHCSSNSNVTIAEIRKVLEQKDYMLSLESETANPPPPSRTEPRKRDKNAGIDLGRKIKFTKLT